MEEFRKVKWLNDCYYVSNLGRVKSYRRNKNGRILKPLRDTKGYVQVLLSDNCVCKKVMVHKLVAECFIPGNHDGLQVNHKDGNRSNNRLENLEWVTPSQNMQHSFKVLGRKPSALGKFGSEAPYHRAVYQYDKNMNLIKKWGSLIEASNHYNDHSSAIWKCANGMTKTCRGFIWRYDPIEK